MTNFEGRHSWKICSSFAPNTLTVVVSFHPEKEFAESDIMTEVLLLFTTSSCFKSGKSGSRYMKEAFDFNTLTMKVKINTIITFIAVGYVYPNIKEGIR